MKVFELYEGFITHLYKEGKAERTILERKRFLNGAILKSIGDMDLESLLITDTSKVKDAGRDQGKSGSKGATVTLRRLLKYAVQANHKLQFYWKDIDIPTTPQKEVTALTVEEIKVIRSAIDRHVYTTERPKDTHAQLRFRAIFELMVHTGMRIGEVLSLDIDDIDFNNETIQITNIKTREVETLSFVGATEYLKAYLGFRHDTCKALFVSLNDDGEVTRHCKESAKSYMRKFRQRMGFKKHLCYHIFRKTYCTLLLENNIDIKSVQYLARHKSERTTLRYYTAVNKTRAMAKNNTIMAYI